MQIKNKYYPYPVIAQGNDSYENKSFLTDANCEIEAHNIRFHFSAELDDEMLEDMIAKGKVKYAHHIECQQTCYRDYILTDKKEYEKVLPEKLFNGLVQICSFLIATEDITGYANPSFSKDYKGFKFNLECGCVLAIGTQVNLQIDKNKDDLAKTSSIFAIRQNHNPNENEIKVTTTGPKIVILIPETTCNQYRSLSNNALLLPVLHSMVVMPSLMQVLYELKEAAKAAVLYEYEDYRWFRALRKTAQKINISFENEDILNMDVYKTAQQFLDVPVVKALSNICSGEESQND